MSRPSVGAGMKNLGNSCYLNATLQALIHIPSFYNYLMNECIYQHTSKCQLVTKNECTLCALVTTLQSSIACLVVDKNLLHEKLKTKEHPLYYL